MAQKKKNIFNRCSSSPVLYDVRDLRPESLKYIASLLRDSRHVRVETSGSSMEEGDRISERMKNTVLDLADVNVDSEKGCVAISTGGNAGILSQQTHHRLY
jgi:hypothetical protein